MTATATMTLEEVSQLQAGDLKCEGITKTVAESGPELDTYYKTNPRHDDHETSGMTGKFWEKVNTIADILREAPEWPFPPIVVQGDILRDGHHRSNAALLVRWDKEIPIKDTWW